MERIELWVYAVVEERGRRDDFKVCRATYYHLMEIHIGCDMSTPLAHSPITRFICTVNHLQITAYHIIPHTRKKYLVV